MKDETRPKGFDPYCRKSVEISDLYLKILSLEERIEDLEIRLNEFEEGDE